MKRPDTLTEAFREATQTLFQPSMVQGYVENLMNKYPDVPPCLFTAFNEGARPVIEGCIGHGNVFDGNGQSASGFIMSSDSLALSSMTMVAGSVGQGTPETTVSEEASPVLDDVQSQIVDDILEMMDRESNGSEPFDNAELDAFMRKMIND